MKPIGGCRHNQGRCAARKPAKLVAVSPLAHIVGVCGDLHPFRCLSARLPRRKLRSRRTVLRTGGCPDGRENHSSELCAQWKAVDAARDSANWARRAFWAGIVSLLLLLFTLWQTRRAIIETRRIGQEQTRAYVSVNAVEVEIGEDPDFGLKAPRPTLTFSNAGATPACNISYYCGASHIKI